MSDNLLSRSVDDAQKAEDRAARDQLGEALAFMNGFKVNALFVVEGTKPVGLVRVHELLRIGVA